MLIFASLSLAIGILALLRPDFMGDNKEFVIGLMLVFEAVLDMVVLILMSRALKRNVHPEYVPEETAGTAGQVPKTAETEKISEVHGNHPGDAAGSGKECPDQENDPDEVNPPAGAE